MQPSSIIRDTIQSLGFLSRLPLPRDWLDGAGDSLKTSIRAFPLAGAVLGLLAGIVLLLADYLRLPALACSFMTVGTLIAMTGALHEDGLGDTADGFFGAATPERRLEIMKDSRIGTFAALTLIIATGLKATLLAAIMQRAGTGYAILALTGAEAASRAAMLALWHGLPSARPGGLADNLGSPKWETLVCALGIGLGILAIAIVPAGGFTALLAALIFTTVLLYGFAKLCMARIGGQTGDTLGAAQQLGVLAILLGLVTAL
ncbi:adenosylcobinamide-GDP ribazoletransferase [Falsochrobactrum sp. TDYN1]|uniref:Adenosylcobinamide-GDP ribazoletransferase n=1 Tax=Falsochrobactrum tianjinense TaxID=2706015 RepID=A0A949PMS1_9HYPH|nr:adenosylcobinamide-GDP ribazoletransferase [Falsochrobactrum sp. TDYN1]MBV2142869.1 adenosylcobinamide-GDP ribazoletransferase [Falsochrobactrum sp. TDYN1]